MARKVPLSSNGVMPPMSLELEISDENKGPIKSGSIDSKPNPTWAQFLPLVFLILIELGAMVFLCYKCEHPAEVSTLQGR